jgi:hypothetical protein
VRELGDRRGDLRDEERGERSTRSKDKTDEPRTNLQPLVEDDLLPLESDVLGPLDESSEVGVGGEVSACDAKKRG